MPIGKILIIAGLVLAALGLIVTFGPKIPFLGKLPGDFHFRKDGFSFYFPLTTCILLSVVVSLILWILRKF